MNRKDLQELSRVRLSEAKSLLQSGFPDGAYYLAGYAVECGLKACTAKAVQRYDFPDKRRRCQLYSRSKGTRASRKLEAFRVAEADADRIFKGCWDIKSRWDIVEEWSEQSRYQRHESSAATSMVEAVGAPKH